MTQRYALAGASGLVGRALAGLVSADPKCTELHLLLRRPLPALEALPHAHAVAWAGGPSMPALPRVDTALCALGTTIAAAGSQAAFRTVDFDAVLAFAKAARSAGAKRFAMVSSLGADPKSAVFYNHIKGEIEQAVGELDFAKCVIARPSLLLGDRSAIGQVPRTTEALAQWFAPVMVWFTPRRLHPIRAETAARGMLAGLAEAGAGTRVIESDELQRLAG